MTGAALVSEVVGDMHVSLARHFAGIGQEPVYVDSGNQAALLSGVGDKGDCAGDEVYHTPLSQHDIAANKEVYFGQMLALSTPS